MGVLLSDRRLFCNCTGGRLLRNGEITDLALDLCTLCALRLHFPLSGHPSTRLYLRSGLESMPRLLLAEDRINFLSTRG